MGGFFFGTELCYTNKIVRKFHKTNHLRPHSFYFQIDAAKDEKLKLFEERSGLEKKIVELEASIKATEKEIKAMVDTHAKEKASMIKCAFI